MSTVASLLTAMRVPEQRDRTLTWALAVSIAIHAVLLTAVLIQRERSLAVDLTRMEQEEIPVEVALVEPPESPIPTEKTSTNLSTVSSEASDLDPRDTQSDTPHGAQLLQENPRPQQNRPQSQAQPTREDGDRSNDRDLPEEQEGLSDAIQQARRGEKTPTTSLDPPHDFAIPAEEPDFGDDGSASMTIGNITLNTTAWDFAPYLLDLKRRIRQKWIPPVAFAQLGAIHGYTWVNFRIYPNGRMEQLSVVETEGHDSLHRSSTNAIKGAAPFRELPDNFPEDYLEITFGFYYLLPGDEDLYFRNGRPIRKDERARDDKGSP